MAGCLLGLPVVQAQEEGKMQVYTTDLSKSPDVLSRCDAQTKLILKQLKKLPVPSISNDELAQRLQSCVWILANVEDLDLGSSESERKAEFEKMKKIAQRGDTESLCFLGVSYLCGLGTEKDLSQALYWCSESVRLGDDDKGPYWLGLICTMIIGGEDYSTWGLALLHHKLGRSKDFGYILSQIYLMWGCGVDACGWYECAQRDGELSEVYITRVSKMMESAAENGDKRMQCAMGLCYACGIWGFDKDYDKALFWLHASAEQDYFPAKRELGYYAGDDSESAKWYYCAALQKSVASIREKNVDVAAELMSESAELYREAAALGNVCAQYELGQCYRYGRGVKENLRNAVDWYFKSATQGNFMAQTALDEIYDKWDIGIAQEMLAATNWEAKAKEQNDAGAQCNLGKCYLYGWGVERNPQEAVTWLKKSAEQGFAEAQYRLADCYMYGRGVEQDREEAVKWYDEALGRHHSQIGSYLYNRDPDVNKIREIVSEYMMKNLPSSGKPATALAKCYLYGKGVAQDKKKGYWLLPHNSDLKEAQYTLAKCLLYGWGCKQDKDAAKQILRKLGDYRGADKLLKQL